MDINNFKYVVNEAKENEVCDIRFFDSVNEYTSNTFISEFLWLESYVKPSKIRVLINSGGGSVLYGMSMFSVIRNSSIPTECINEGLAASISSIVWAAGDKSLMRDYAILMIHNPFCPSSNETEDSCKTKNEVKEEPDYVKAFRQQIEMIYMKRWGFSKTKVKAIMEGKEGADGTFFTADEAVKAGIITSDSIIKTDKQKISRVKNAIEGVTDSQDLIDTITSVCNNLSIENTELEENKPSTYSIPNLNKNNNLTKIENKTKTKNMNENDKTVDFSFGAVVASLGFKEKTDVSQVMARITELIGIENELKEAKQVIDSLKIEKTGEITKNQNLTQELNSVKAQLKTYQDAEKEALNQSILDMVQNAIDAGKIEDSAKSTWVDMATKNFDLAKSTLDSIPARQKISTEIENDSDNIANIQDSLTTAEAKIAEEISSVVGKDFKFKTID